MQSTVVCQHRYEHFTMGQRRHIQFMPARHENIHPRRLFPARGQPQVSSHGEPLPDNRDIEAQQLTHLGANAIGSHRQPGAPGLPFHYEPVDPAVFQQRTVHGDTAVCGNAGRSARGVKQHLVQVSASLAAPKNRETGKEGESPFSRVLAEMIAHTIEGNASNRVCQTQPIKNRHSGGHQPFAAGFFAREDVALSQPDGAALPPKQNRQGGAGYPPANDQKFHHNRDNSNCRFVSRRESVSPNTVHLMIRMRSGKSRRWAQFGLRGRNG